MWRSLLSHAQTPLAPVIAIIFCPKHCRSCVSNRGLNICNSGRFLINFRLFVDRRIGLSNPLATLLKSMDDWFNDCLHGLTALNSEIFEFKKKIV